MKGYENQTIRTVIEAINATYFLPDIQRPFVWKPEQITRLFDSLMRTYPISTMLFWKIDKKYMEKNKIKAFTFVNNNIEDNSEQIHLMYDEYILILDGQQRLTSLYLTLKGCWITKDQKSVLYFNAISGDEEDEDGIRYEFSFMHNSNDKYFFENIEDQKKVWVKVSDVFSQELGSSKNERKYIEEICKATSIKGKKVSDKIKDNILDLYRVLCTENLISYYKEEEEDYERVLDIFVRTNSGGTKLSYSDLLFSTIKLHWQDARNNFSNLLERININNFDFDNDLILKCCLLFYARNPEDVRFSKRNLDKAKIKKISDEWENRIEPSLLLAVDFLKLNNITDKRLLISTNAIIPIVYWAYKNNITSLRTDKEYNIQDTLKWFIKSMLTGVFGAHSDTILAICKNKIDASINKSFPCQEIENHINSLRGKNTILDEYIVDKIKYSNKESYLLLSLCYNGAVNFAPLTKGNLPEQDHIFSKKELQEAGFKEEEINTIYNIRFVTQADNRSKKDKTFIDWVNNLTDKNNVFLRHCIPTDKNYTIENYKEFLHERKKLLLNKIAYL